MRKKARSGRHARDVMLDIAVRKAEGSKPRSLKLRLKADRPVALPKLAPLEGAGSWSVPLRLEGAGAKLELAVDGAAEGCIVTVAVGRRVLARGEAGGGKSLSFAVDPLALRFTASDAPIAWEGKARLDVRQASGRQRAQVRKGGWRGRVLLRQDGPSLTGFLDLGAPPFPLDGEVVEAADGTTRLDLRGTGYLDEHLSALTLAGTIRGDRLTGGFTASLVGGGALFFGDAFFDVLLCQNPPGQQPPKKQDPAGPPQDNCGELLWTSGIMNGEFGPAGARQRYLFRVLRYERCVRIEYLDGAGNVVQRSELTLDLNHNAGGDKRVLVYDRAMTDEPMTAPGSGQLRVSGEAKIILVRGCSRIRFEQWLRQSTRTLRPNGAPDGAPDEQDWACDGTAGQAYPGTFPPEANAGDIGMADVPGLDAEGLRVVAFQAIQELNGKANGSRYVARFEFETFICCDGTLLGIVAWGLELTWTVTNDHVPRTPTVTKTRPTWRTPAQSQSRARVRCGQ